MTDSDSHNLRLVVTPALVSLVGEMGETLASGVPDPVERRLGDLLWRLDHARRRGSSAEVAHRLRLVGEALGTTFCAGPVADALIGRIAKAERFAVRLGIRADDALVADMPWEACVLPGQIRPLGLERGLDVYRDVDAGNWVPCELRAPLRVLVALAAPIDGPPLDLDAEVGRIHDALGSTLRLANGRVRLISQGSLAALADALAEERFHVVHISCHASPGQLILEDEHGMAQRVTARELATAITRTQPVELVVLSGCSTALGVAPEGQELTQAALPGLGRQLVAAGMPAVLAMTAPVTDDFTPRLAEHFYRGLATSPEPEPLTVLSAARRDLEAARLVGQSGAREAELVEWATPALFLGGPSCPLFRIGDGIDHNVRTTSQDAASLVGRRTELGGLTELLRSKEGSHVVLHGIEGIGKFRMAEALVGLLRTPETLAVTLRGATTADEVVASLPRATAAILVCDEFETNLARIGPGQYMIRDGKLAGLLGELLRPGGAVKVIFTSRYPFSLGHGQTEVVVLFQPWLLDDAFSQMLMFRLRALGCLPGETRSEVLAKIGGHPRALELLEGLLEANGDAAQAIVSCIDLLMVECDLKRKLEELDETAFTVLLDASVHRWAAPESAVLAHPVHIPETAYPEALRVLVAEGLIVRQGSTAHGESTLLVPRWIAAVLERRSANETLKSAHGKAAFAIRQDLEAEQDVEEQIELLTAAQYHHQRAGELLYANEASNRLSEILFSRGQWRRLERMHHENLKWLPPDSADVGTAHQELSRLLVSRSDYDGAQSHAMAALRVFERVGDRQLMATMHHALAVIEEKQSRFAAAAASCEAALQLIEDVEAPEVVAACHALLGNIAGHTGDDVALREHYAYTIAIWSGLWPDQPRAEMAMIYKNFATVHGRRGEYEESIEVLLKAAAILEELGNVDGYASIYHDLGLLAQDRRDDVGAMAYFRKAVQLRESLDDYSGAAIDYHELGILASDRGDLDGASAYHRKAMLAYQEVDDQRGIGYSYHEMSLIANRRGDIREACALAEHALAVKELAGDRPGLAPTLIHLGYLLERQGETEEALVLYSRAARLSVELGLLPSISDSHRALGKVALDQGHLDSAASAFDRALTASRHRSRPDAIILDLLWLARVRFFQSDLAVSSVLYEEARELADRENDRVHLAEARNQLGLIALIGEDFPRARAHFSAALDLVQAIDDRYNIAGCLRNLANVDRLEGKLEQAFAHYRQAQEIFISVDAVRDATAGYHELATIHRQRGETGEALNQLQRYADAAKTSSDTDAYIEALHDIAEIRTDLGLREEAVLSAVEAFVMGAEFRSPFVRETLSLLLRQRGTFGEAAFRHALENHLSPDAFGSIVQILDSQQNLSDGPRESS